MRRAAAALAVSAALALPAAAECRLALTLAIDVSSSVDAGEYRLQMDGLAAALEDPQVRDALFQVPGAWVALQVYEWSGVTDQTILRDWTEVTSPQVLDGIAADIRAHARRYVGNPTALGEAIRFGRRQLDRAPPCAESKIDVSGDGQSNAGIPPQQIYGGTDFAGVIVNGLAIQSDEQALGRYYRFFVIWGPGAFVEVADSFEDYAAAIRRKLIRELGVPQLGMR